MQLPALPTRSTDSVWLSQKRSKKPGRLTLIQTGANRLDLN